MKTRDNEIQDGLSGHHGSHGSASPTYAGEPGSAKAKARNRRWRSAALQFPRASCFLLLTALALVCGCQELTYRGPNGERFSRRCLGTSTSLGLLSIDTATNGVRRVELQGYRNDGTQSLGVVTEAAVRAAIQGATR